MPTEDVLDAMDWGLDYVEFWQEQGDHPHGKPNSFFKQFKNAVLDNFSEYQVPVIDLGKDTRKEAVLHGIRESKHGWRIPERV